MRKALTFINIALLLASFFSFIVYASSSNSYYADCDTFYQQKSNWCWVASAQCSATYENELTPYDQYDAVRFLKGTPSTPYPNVGGTILDTERAAEYIVNMNVDYFSANCTYPGEFFVSQILSNHVAMAGAGYYDQNGNRTGGHVTPILGISHESGTRFITYYDPYYNRNYRMPITSFFDGSSFNGRKYDQTCGVR